MIKQEDIKKAIKTFKEWDNEGSWKTPSQAYIQHTLKKSEDAIRTAQIILKIMEDVKAQELFDAVNYDGSLWIINASYYRILFMAQYLLALEGKKLPDNAEDSHKTIELALMYYFIIKGSNLEAKKDLKWDDIKDSRLSKALELLADAKEENEQLTQQKAKKIVELMEAERTKRHEFTYSMTINAEISKARTSLARAVEFGDIIKQYINARMQTRKSK